MIEHIARELSRRPAYPTGAAWPYSLAQRSVYIAMMCPRRFHLHGLLSYAALAYHTGLESLEELRETRDAVLRHHGLEPTHVRLLDTVVRRVLATERRDGVVVVCDGLLHGVEPYQGIVVVRLAAEQAEAEFLSAYREHLEDARRTH